MSSDLKLSKTSPAYPRPWYAPRSPDQVEPYPWLHPSAVDYLEALLTPDMWVLEHGAGGSTLWFAGKVQHVITVEHNPEWRQKIQDLAPAHNVTVLERLPDLGYVYDLFFIDGERAQRGNCLEMAHLYVRPGGWVVLDNANRPEYAQQREGLRQHARLIERFDNNIPRFHYIVTEFWQQICEPK